MDYIYLIGAFLLSIALGVVLVPNILLISHKKRLFDLPNSRKIHDVPVPRLGGVSFFPAILISMSFMIGLCYFQGQGIEDIPAEHTLYGFLFLEVGCMALYLVGVADDLVGVGYKFKFVIQIVAAILLVISGNWLNTLDGLFGIHMLPTWVGVLLTVVVVVYIINAINLIDGIDGLASGLSCISLVSLAAIFVLKGDHVYAMLAISALGVLMPFWFYNVFGNAQRGHKLFMGDTGSLTLGYIISFLVIHLARASRPEDGSLNTGMILGFSTLLVPLLDVARVVIHRLREGKSPFLPDKNHFHHKLQRAGLRIRMILVTILCVSLFFIVLNVVLVRNIDVTALLLLDIAIWTAMQVVINGFIKLRKEKQTCNK